MAQAELILDRLLDLQATDFEVKDCQVSTDKVVWRIISILNCQITFLNGMSQSILSEDGPKQKRQRSRRAEELYARQRAIGA